VLQAIPKLVSLGAAAVTAWAGTRRSFNTPLGTTQLVESIRAWSDASVCPEKKQSGYPAGGDRRPAPIILFSRASATRPAIPAPSIRPGSGSVGSMTQWAVDRRGRIIAAAAP
jgi:hypothetical protein